MMSALKTLREHALGRAVLHCYADVKWTGPSEPVAQLCRGLCRRGWRSDLACMPDSADYGRTLPRKARQWGIEVFDRFHFDSRPNLRRNLADVAGLCRLIQDGDYALIHAHGTWDNFLAAWALRRLGWPIPLVRTDHSGREYRRNPLHWFYYGPRFSHHLILLSDRRRVQAVGRVGRDPDSVSTVRGSVNVADWRPIEPPPGLRKELGFGVDDVVTGIVARVQYHRRFDVLLQAARIVRRRDRRVKIIVLGRGTHKEEILDRPVVEMGLEDTVIPGGYRKEDYREVLGTFDAGLMLVPGSDGSCRAAMQMAAMEKPLVVARRGVLPDIVKDGETGIVVKDEPERLAEALLQMGASAERRRRWGAAARQRMVRHFSLERRAAEVEQVYRLTLAAERQ